MSQSYHQQQGQKAAPLATVPVVAAAEGSFIRDLPEVEFAAHSVLAALRSNFEDAGWGQPLAVAVIRREGVSATVFATADGLSVWPTGVRLPDAVYPITYFPEVQGDTTLLGHLDPARKLRLLRTDGVQLILTTEPVEGADGENTPPVQTQTPAQYREIVSAGDAPSSQVVRGAELDPDDAGDRLEKLGTVYPEVPDPDEAAETLRSARWTDEQPGNYVRLYVEHLVSEAVAASRRGDLGGCVYLGDQALDLLNLPDDIGEVDMK